METKTEMGYFDEMLRYCLFIYPEGGVPNCFPTGIPADVPLALVSDLQTLTQWGKLPPSVL